MANLLVDAPTSRSLLLAGGDLECPQGQSLTFLTCPKRTAPRKRNMVAWRRRLIPRVMQCPRQQYVLAALQKVQRLLLKKSDAETKRSLPPYLTVGWSSRLFPAVGDPVCMAPCGGVVLLWRRDRRGGLIERDADALILAPDDMARPLQLF